MLVIVFKVSHKHENDTKGALHSVELAWSEELVTPGAMNHIQQKASTVAVRSNCSRFYTLTPCETPVSLKNISRVLRIAS